MQQHSFYVLAILAVFAAARHEHAFGHEVLIESRNYDASSKGKMEKIIIKGIVYDLDGEEYEFHSVLNIPFDYDINSSVWFAIEFEVPEKNYVVVGEARSNPDKKLKVAFVVKT